MTHRSTTNVTVTEDRIISDFSESNWLKSQLIKTNQRDCLDALYDTKLLLSLLEARCNYSEERILSSFEGSYWLKRQIVESRQRELSDAVRDVTILHSILELRCIQAGIG